MLKTVNYFYLLKGLFKYLNKIRSLKMGQIEYEYPLFKVYYSNTSNNSNIRGNPASTPSRILDLL